MGGLIGHVLAKKITNQSTLNEMAETLISFYFNRNQSQSTFINKKFTKTLVIYALCFFSLFFSKRRNGLPYCCFKSVLSKTIIAKHLDLLNADNGVLVVHQQVHLQTNLKKFNISNTFLIA